MPLDVRFRTVAFVSAISSLVQGIAVCVLTALSFMSFGCSLNLTLPNNDDDYTYQYFLASYFEGNSCQPELHALFPELDHETVPQKLLLLNVFIFVFNFFLCVSSATLMFALWTEKNHLAFGWALCYVMMSYCTSILDLAAVLVVSLDYGEVADSSSLQYAAMKKLTLMSLIFIAARGIYIWFSNVAFAVYLSFGLCKEVGCGKQKSVTPNHNPSSPTFKDAVRCRHCNASPAFQYGEDIDKPVTFERDSRAWNYPSYSAYGRWPQLAPENKSVVNERPRSFPGQLSAPATPSRNPRRVRTPAASDTISDQPNFPAPPLILQARPGSLEEAIKTVKPLRRVNRPPLL